MKIRSLLFLSVILFAATQAFSQSKDDEPLKRLIGQLVTAQIKYDNTTLDKLFTVDYIEISPVGEFDPREKVLGFYKPELKPDPAKFSSSVDPTEWSIRVRDKSAVVIVRFDFTITADGKKLPPRGLRATFVCAKEKGVWKIGSAQYTGIKPSSPPKPE